MKDFKEFAAEPLAFPINGRQFVVPPISALVGLRIVAAEEDNAETDESIARLVLGTAYDEMLAAGVPAAAFARATLTAITDFRLGRELAELTWDTGSLPEALAAKMAAISTTPESLTASESATP